jgi:hypothetical protein
MFERSWYNTINELHVTYTIGLSEQDVNLYL